MAFAKGTGTGTEGVHSNMVGVVFKLNTDTISGLSCS